MDKLPISLCMIVKNEERYLAACLESVHEWIDEIVIVDTGSTDSTTEIAKRYDASVYKHTWRNDFAEARNAAVGFAKNPWILQLDADEEICRDDVIWFFETYPWADATGYYLDIHNLTKESNDEVSLIHRLVRFYRNHPDIYYESAIHETLRIPKLQVYNSSARIIHKGYNQNANKKLKRQRNFEILQAKLENSPHDPFLLAYLARYYEMGGEYDKAIKMAEKSLWQGVTFPMRRHLLHSCFDYAFIKRDDSLLKKYFALLPTPDVFPDYYYYQGRNFEMNGDMDRAISCYQKYRQVTGGASRQHNDSYIPNLEVDLRRREALLMTRNGRFSDAILLMEDALKIAPSAYQLWAELGQYQFKLGQVEAASLSFENVLKALNNVSKTPENEALKLRYSQLIKKLNLLILQ